MKPFLCKLGFHKPANTTYLRVRKCRHNYNGSHKWHRNYVICRRCGKRLATFAIQKVRAER